MKYLFLFLFSCSVFASYNQQQIGDTTYGYDTNGTSVIQQRIGGFDYITETNSRGQSHTTTCQQIGNQTYCN